MRAVDTNVLVRLIARDDAKQVAAAESFVTPGAWISHLVLVETTWVLTSVYALQPASIATAIEMLLDHATLSVEEPDDGGHVEAAWRYPQADEDLECVAVDMPAVDRVTGLEIEQREELFLKVAGLRRTHRARNQHRRVVRDLGAGAEPGEPPVSG